MTQITVEYKRHLLLYHADSNSSLYFSSFFFQLQTNLFKNMNAKMHEHEDELHWIALSAKKTE